MTCRSGRPFRLEGALPLVPQCDSGSIRSCLVSSSVTVLFGRCSDGLLLLAPANWLTEFYGATLHEVSS